MLQFVRVVVGLLLIGAVSACANPEAAQSSRRTVRISVGRISTSPNSAVSHLVDAYRALPQFSLQDVPFTNNEQRLAALQDGTLDVTMAVDDLAYRAVHGTLPGEPRRLDKLRGIVSLHRAPVHLLVGAKTPPLSRLKGLHVVLGSPLGTNSAFGEKLLASAGVPLSDIRGEFLPYDVAASRLLAGEFDAAIMTGMLPLEPVTTALEGGARLRAISAEEADRLRTHYPLLKAMLIPRNTYPTQIEPVQTVSVALLLVCRADLDNELVYELTRAYFEQIPQDLTRQTDLQRAPATVIPLHPGAARYYREREMRQ